jgi:hypothetical protein
MGIDDRWRVALDERLGTGHRRAGTTIALAAGPVFAVMIQPVAPANRAAAPAPPSRSV